MNKTVAWALIGASLGAGVVAGQVLARSAAPLVELSITCLLLEEATKAGHLTPEKRGALLARLAKAPEIQGKDREIAAMLARGCPMLPGGAR